MANLLSEAKLTAITTVEEARDWAGLATAPWTALNETFRNIPTLGVFAFVPLFAFKEAIQDARVPVEAQGDPGDANYVLATTRQVTIRGHPIGINVTGGASKI